MLQETETRLARWAGWLALVGFAGLMVLALMTTLDVMLRWLLAMPLSGVNDVSANVMAVVIAACIPASLAARQNISVEILGPLLGGHVQRFLVFFASLVTLLFIAAIAWKFIPYTQGLYTGQRRTWVLGWMIWPWWAVSTVFLGCAVLVQALVTLTDLAALLRGTPAATAE